MKSYLALAWKELKAQKITAILILVAVIMSTIMTTVIGQSIGILQSMRIQEARQAFSISSVLSATLWILERINLPNIFFFRLFRWYEGVRCGEGEQRKCRFPANGRTAPLVVDYLSKLRWRLR